MPVPAPLRTQIQDSSVSAVKTDGLKQRVFARSRGHWARLAEDGQRVPVRAMLFHKPTRVVFEPHRSANDDNSVGAQILLARLDTPGSTARHGVLMELDPGRECRIEAKLVGNKFCTAVCTNRARALKR